MKLSLDRGVNMIYTTALLMCTLNMLTNPSIKAKLVAILTLLPTTACLCQNTSAGIEFFESKIRPVLIEHCYECHSQESKKSKGGLLLDTREATLRGGDSGAAVSPGKPDASLLISAINHADSELEMPPKYKLDESVIADFRKWIEMGAPDPRKSDSAGIITSVIDIEEGRKFWAYQDPKQVAVPEFPAGSWPNSDIDRYIYSALKEAKLEPVTDADPATLLRRLYIDLTGLPPKPNSVAHFIKACAEDRSAAVVAVVDQLLSSPQFGERWGRHWLDVARYAESNGRDVNVVYYPEAWRYRDYVIKSFNDDKPYDVFVTEQIAGDKLTSPNDKQNRAQQIIGTGFLAIGPKNLNAKNSEQFSFDLIDEQIQTLGKAMLGTTISCARCHDHKFDPIPQSDYYALAGIFQSSDTLFGTYSSVQNRHASVLIELPITETKHGFKPLSADEMTAKKAQLGQAQGRMREMKGELFRARRAGGSGPDQSTRRKLLQLNHVITMLEKEINTYNEAGKPIALAMGINDSKDISDARFLVRGEVALAKETVPRGFLQVLSSENSVTPLATDSSGRLELAKWIASPENPLTARVMVNRVWMHLMGEGIVASVDNFGATGTKPSHPELLDYLALKFVDDWSVKKLIRTIVLSRTYQLSSDFENSAFTTDPDNTLRWRANKRRLDAESLRDSILAVSGKLETEPPYGSVITQQSLKLRGGGSADIDGFEYTSPHRSIYLPIIRKQIPDSLDIFDFADPNMSVGKRETTTVPSQALFLLNSDFVRTQAEAVARLLIENDNIRQGQTGAAAFYLIYGRQGSADELRKASIFFKKSLELAKTESSSDKDSAYFEALTEFCHALFASADFLYVN